MHPSRGNGLWRLGLPILIALCLGGPAAGAAQAGGPAGRNPPRDYRSGRLPLACHRSTVSARCINGAVYWLDRARAKLHQGPYRLPANFASLTPAEQAFVLTNLDRIHYRLAPIAGLTSQLNGWAMDGARRDLDPAARGGLFRSVSVWAFGFTNIVTAYEAWMYDDGYGGGNLDCTSPQAADCWGHRHSILWSFGPGGRLAMGAAAGYDQRGRRSYALILGRASGGLRPGYYYTWAQARAAGAGTNDYAAHIAPSVDLYVHARGRKIVALIAAPRSARATCRVSKSRNRHWVLFQSWRCYAGREVVGEASSGQYRFRLSADGRQVTQYVTLR
jgi:hypothetical protein